MPVDLNIATDPARHPDESAIDPGRGADGSKGYMGVTRILREAGVCGDLDVADAILERGSEVHRACHEWLTGKKKPKLPKEWSGYLKAFQRFISDSRFAVEISEKLALNDRYKVSGHVDLMGILSTSRVETSAVIEIKTGRPQPWTRLQLAGYAWLFRGVNAPVLRRLALWLRDDGTYDVTNEFPCSEMMADVQTFLACQRVAAFRRRFAV